MTRIHVKRPQKGGYRVTGIKVCPICTEGIVRDKFTGKHRICTLCKGEGTYKEKRP